jgi:hypothetical protein
VLAIEGNKIAPALADRYLARSGFDSQQTDQPVSPERPNNLFEPVAGDFGAHGIFDREAHDFSPQTWFSRHKQFTAVACASLFGAVAVMLKRS